MSNPSENTSTPLSTPVRLGLLVLLVVGCYLTARFLGLDTLSVEQLRARLVDAGPLGMVAFVLVFAVSQLAFIPGVVFVVAGAGAYGPWVGLILGLVGGTFSVAVGMLVARRVAGQPLAAIESPRMQRWLGHISKRPIIAVAMLRMIFWLAPPVTYALAFSDVRLRDYVIGSCLGLVLPVILLTQSTEWVLRFFAHCAAGY